MKKEKGKNILIGFLITIIILLIVLLVLIVTGVVNIDSIIKNNQDSNMPNIKENSVQKEISDEELKTIINEELSVLGGKTKLSDLTNQEKLWFSFRKVFADYPDSFEANKLTDYFESTSLSSLEMTLEDIGYFGSSKIQYLYNKENNSYKINPEFSASSVNTVETVYTKIDNITNKDGKYTAKVRYLWYYMEPSSLYNIYGSYNDALNNTNSLTSEPVNLDSLTDAQKEEYLNNDNIETYNYIFEKENGKINIVDFYVS